MTTVEPEWSEREQAVMLALAEYRAGLCPSCGLPRSECGAIENDGRFEAEPRRCHATAARMIAAERYQQNPQAGALLYSVRLRDRE